MSQYIVECSERAKKSINELRDAGYKADLLEISEDVWVLIQMGGFNHSPGRDMFAGLPVKRVSAPRNYIKALDSSALITWTIYHNTWAHPGKYVALEFKGKSPLSVDFNSADLDEVLKWVAGRTLIAGRQEQATQYPRQQMDPPDIYCTIR